MVTLTMDNATAALVLVAVTGMELDAEADQPASGDVAPKMAAVREELMLQLEAQR